MLDVRLVDAPAGVTQEKDHTGFLHLRCLPYFLSREGFSRPFPSSTVKSNFVYSVTNRSPDLSFFCFVFVRKNPSSCEYIEIRTHVRTSESFEVTS